MSKTSFGTLDPATRKVWAKDTMIRAEQSTYFSKFIGTSPDSLIVKMDDLEKNHGDEITLSLLEQLPDTAFEDGERLSGKGCKLEFAYEKITICLKRKAVEWETLKSGQRVPYKIRQMARANLQRWSARMMDFTFFAHLAGDTTANGDAFRNGGNYICAPSENRICYPDGHECEDTIDQDPSAVLTFDRLSEAKRYALNLDQCGGEAMRPLSVGGEEMLAVFLSDCDALALRRDECWKDMQMAAAAGGDIRNNPIFTGALGIWDGMIFYETTRLPNGISKETCEKLCNVKRTVIAGAGAMTLAYGGIDGAKSMWTEEVSDHEACKEIGYTTMFGMKKNRYQPVDLCKVPGKFDGEGAEDYATLILPSYAKPIKGKPEPAGEGKTSSKKAA